MKPETKTKRMVKHGSTNSDGHTVETMPVELSAPEFNDLLSSILTAPSAL